MRKDSLTVLNELRIRLRGVTSRKKNDSGSNSSAVRIRTSPFGDSIGYEFKAYLIDSTESGSSEDELPEPSDIVTDIAEDLTILFVFTVETRRL